MPRFFYGALPRRIKLHRTFPVLVAAFVLPSDRRRERSPVFFSSLKSLAGFSSLFLPQVPIPDTSKIKDRLLGTLPSWTVESAVSKFVKKPDADIIVGISMQMTSLSAFVMYYPKETDIVMGHRTNFDVEEYTVRMPTLRMVDDWDMAQDGEHRAGTLPVMKYSSEFPHLPLGPGLYVNNSDTLWDPERHDFRVHFSDFFPTQDSPFSNLKPPAFDLTEKQIMTDYARAIRQNIEAFINREIVDDAMIVNGEPMIKWMVLYPDCMDSIETAPGVTVKRNFVSALKDAGFPVNNSDIPSVRPENLHEGNEDRFNESVLEDLNTASSMIEFLSVGFASLIHLSSFLNRQGPGPPFHQEKPFIAVIDDEEYLTARRSVFTSSARFGVMQQQVCSVSRSPTFKGFPDVMLDIVASILHEMDVFEKIDSESIKIISKFGIKHWPESENWADVLDVLDRKMDKLSLPLKATGSTCWAVGFEGDETPQITPISAFEFAKVVRNELFAPTISTFGDIHGSSPEIKDAILIDSGRGETAAYSIILRGIYTLKDEFSQFDNPMPEDIFILGPDLAKLLDIALEAGTVQKEHVDQDEEYFIREISKSYSHLDRDRYDRMNVTVAQPGIHQTFQGFGLVDAAGVELSRIFLEAYRK
ncbi:hypothetical protein TWF718_006280 [Orbilia javanica]|uniref:Uncharacterized protein n=1 Tax=Orbilia javanica TaxID=47235 RepID=A0AAN8RJT6_9PEZI